MTPQERELVADLFSRLAELEREPRDPDADRTIREGLSKAPNALYALVQTVLLQDEALKAADDHIQELEDQLAQRGGAQGGPPTQQQGGGFLDRMRGSFSGRDEPRGSVPQTGGERPTGSPWGSRGGGGGYDDGPRMAGGPDMGGGPGGPMGGGPFGGGGMGGGPFGSGGMMGGGGPMGGGPMGGAGRGGFLGTAAAAAAGAIGGGLLMNGIRSAMGGAGGGQAGGAGRGPFAGAFDQLSGGGKGGSSASESGGANPLSREAGLDDIGSSRRAGFANTNDQ
ncbi:MAG: uncharacterized protein QOD74_1131, partial [Variibacter sp.]|nr:uncharacterized protein [Variibacter sp.]